MTKFCLSFFFSHHIPDIVSSFLLPRSWAPRPRTFQGWRRVSMNEWWIKGNGRMTLIFFFCHVQSHFLLLQLNKYNEAALFHPLLPQAFSMSAMLVWVIWRIRACKITKNNLVSQSHPTQKCLNARKKRHFCIFWTAFYVVSKEHFITVGAGFNARVRQRQGDVSQGRPAKEKQWSLDWLIESKCTVPDNKAEEKWHATFFLFFPIMELKEADRPHRRTSIIAVNLRRHLSCYISVSYFCSLQCVIQVNPPEKPFLLKFEVLSIPRYCKPLTSRHNENLHQQIRNRPYRMRRFNFFWHKTTETTAAEKLLCSWP